MKWNRFLLFTLKTVYKVILLRQYNQGTMFLSQKSASAPLVRGQSLYCLTLKLYTVPFIPPNSRFTGSCRVYIVRTSAGIYSYSHFKSSAFILSVPSIQSDVLRSSQVMPTVISISVGIFVAKIYV